MNSTTKKIVITSLLINMLIKADEQAVATKNTSLQERLKEMQQKKAQETLFAQQLEKQKELEKQKKELPLKQQLAFQEQERIKNIIAKGNYSQLKHESFSEKEKFEILTKMIEVTKGPKVLHCFKEWLTLSKKVKSTIKISPEASERISAWALDKNDPNLFKKMLEINPEPSFYILNKLREENKYELLNYIEKHETNRIEQLNQKQLKKEQTEKRKLREQREIEKINQQKNNDPKLPVLIIASLVAIGFIFR